MMFFFPIKLNNQFFFSFRIIQCIYEEESDIRQVYCLVAICYILQIWPIDKEKLASYIISCQVIIVNLILEIIK